VQNLGEEIFKNEIQKFVLKNRKRDLSATKQECREPNAKKSESIEQEFKKYHAIFDGCG
jgi:hypothetical protein